MKIHSLFLNLLACFCGEPNVFFYVLRSNCGTYHNLISKIAKNAVKCCSATVFQGLATVFWRLATVQNGVSDSKITPSDNPFLDGSELSLTLPEPEFEQKSFFVPSDETEQDDEID